MARLTEVRYPNPVSVADEYARIGYQIAPFQEHLTASYELKQQKALLAKQQEEERAIAATLNIALAAEPTDQVDGSVKKANRFQRLASALLQVLAG